VNRLRAFAHEGARYFGASAAALAVDFGSFMGLHRLAGLDYRIAAPIGFSLGLLLIYLLSVRWVFSQRRLKDARAEFALFASLGLAGLLLNQAIITAGMELLALADWMAKIASASVVFSFNFASRKFLLFTRYS
jgi:putative flippase GtrA